VFGTGEPMPNTTPKRAFEEHLIVLAISGAGLRN
jgi:hypothetical protein